MRLRFLTLNFLITIAILGTFLPLAAKAVSSDDVLVNVSPENPAPGENVNISLKSYVNNLDIVLISWSVNGKNVSSGIGKKSFSLNAPSAGGETSVIATASLPDGAVDTKVIIRPSAMVLLSEALDSYTPPFYKGKALPSPDSLVKVVALPEIKSGSNFINPKNLTYAWQKDYTSNQDGSGYGKNTFTYVNDYLENSNNIGVTAGTTDQKFSSTVNIDVRMKEPKIIFYKNDAKLGTIWEQALADGYKILGNEIIEAAPYFFSPRDIRVPLVTFDWFINSQTINVPSYRKNILPLQAQVGTSGTSKIRLEINNADKIFESAVKEINVNF
ncbi:MAG: hypothetical protein PHT16_00675 [Candidatus Pacebacteria bacterium]|nr:hypothetical protein [Candidatus Paceibacterota bacterium]